MSDRYRMRGWTAFEQSHPTARRVSVVPKGLTWLRSFIRFLAGRVRSGKIIDKWGRMTRDLLALVGIRAERVHDRYTRPLTPRDPGRFGGGMYERPWVEFEWEMTGEYDGSQLARDNRRRFREQQLIDFKRGKIKSLQFT